MQNIKDELINYSSKLNDGKYLIKIINETLEDVQKTNTIYDKFIDFQSKYDYIIKNNRCKELDILILLITSIYSNFIITDYHIINYLVKHK